MNARIFLGVIVLALVIGAGSYLFFFRDVNTTSYTAHGVSPVVIDSQIATSTTPARSVEQAPQQPSPTPTPVVIKPASQPTPAPIPKPTPTLVPTPKVPAPTPKPTGYTMAQVSMHADQSSCWTVISRSVYNLTDYISMHPGGSERILSICGGDGTSAFEGQHMGNVRVESVLANYRLGALI